MPGIGTCPYCYGLYNHAPGFDCRPVAPRQAALDRLALLEAEHAAAVALARHRKECYGCDKGMSRTEKSDRTYNCVQVHVEFSGTVWIDCEEALLLRAVRDAAVEKASAK